MEVALWLAAYRFMVAWKHSGAIEWQLPIAKKAVRVASIEFDYMNRINYAKRVLVAGCRGRYHVLISIAFKRNIKISCT